ncbi:alpha/beta fold hydrolase [Actinocorallia sp. API 0066]|uniref:alpha/beta fold hydrolase n=1 Tax=Actinocorallia sp. API 0066 TaxID=2896846 RepID=UPI001E3E009A|nr:alpha/beta fold hydrolase [Actinocorallia sp. API 0066]MCD0453455.1 alpha/beta fold hydrolase [Actinocorallia sp. API 0066]
MREKVVVVAVHGGPGGEHGAFKPVLSGLADKAQVVYVDHRGSGRSERGARETYTLENNVEDLEALREYLGFERIALLGVSYGGMVALTYATRYPRRLSHLIAVVTAPSHRFLPRAREILAERGTPEQRAAAEPLWTGTFESEEQLRAYFEVLGPLYSRTYDLAKSRERPRILNPEALNEGFAGFLRTYDVTGELHRITAPTLVIGGRHDWICPPEFSAEIAAAIPGADLRIFEDSGHSVMSDEPDAFLDVVRGFLTYTGRP